MVKYAQVIKAVIDKLKTQYPEIAYTSVDVDEGITRPSFMVDLSGITERNFMKAYRDKEFIISIKYFSSKARKNTLENLEVIERLSELFVDDDLIHAAGFSIQIYDEIEVEVIDSVVHYNIPIFISEAIDINDDSLQLEELDLSLRKDG